MPESSWRNDVDETGGGTSGEGIPEHSWFNGVIGELLTELFKLVLIELLRDMSGVRRSRRDEPMSSKLGLGAGGESIDTFPSKGLCEVAFRMTG